MVPTISPPCARKQCQKLVAPKVGRIFEGGCDPFLKDEDQSILRKMKVVVNAVLVDMGGRSSCRMSEDLRRECILYIINVLRDVLHIFCFRVKRSKLNLSPHLNFTSLHLNSLNPRLGSD